MKVLVDTTIWSLALRRRAESLGDEEHALVAGWRHLVRRAQIGIIGPIRQEVLSGVRGEKQFDALRTRLAAFRNTPLEDGDYVAAAEMFNTCRAKGVAGSPIDLVICAVARRLRWSIFTTDPDFAMYGAHVPVRLHRVT